MPRFLFRRRYPRRAGLAPDGVTQGLRTAVTKVALTAGVPAESCRPVAPRKSAALGQ